MNEKEVANSSEEINVQAGVVKVDHDMEEVQKFSKSKEKKTQLWEKYLLHIQKGFALTHLLKFNLWVVRPCKRFNCFEGKSKGQNIDEKIHAIFGLVKLVQANNGGYVDKTLSSYVFKFFVAKTTKYEDQRQDQERKCEDEETDKGEK